MHWRHYLHAKQAVAALKAGKHVLCEKPWVLNEQELNSILDCYGLTADAVRAAPSPLPNAFPLYCLSAST